MYVAPARAGAASPGSLLAALEDEARELGYDFVRLETGDQQPEAIKLYASSGYRADPPLRPVRGRPAQPLLREAPVI